MDVASIIIAIVFGSLANFGALVAFRVSLEHRLTKLETKFEERHGSSENPRRHAA